MKTVFKKSLSTSVILSTLLCASGYAPFANASNAASPVAGGSQVTIVGILNDGGILDQLESIERSDREDWNKQMTFFRTNLEMEAPTEKFSAAIGEAIKGNKSREEASMWSHKNFMNNIGLYTAKEDVSFPEGSLVSPPEEISTSTSDIVEKMKPFFSRGARSVPGGKGNNISSTITADILDKDNLTKGKITDDDIDLWINLLTKAIPGSVKNNATLRTNMKGGAPGIADKEAVGDIIIEYAAISASAYALSDIIARRKGDPSVMDIMTKYANERITQPDWHATIATSSDTALLREITHMMAYQVWMASQHFRLVEQQTALISAMNSTIAQLNTQMRDIQKQIASAQSKVSGQDLQGQESSGSAGSGIISEPTPSTESPPVSNNSPRAKCSESEEENKYIPGCTACKSGVAPGSPGCSPTTGSVADQPD